MRFRYLRKIRRLQLWLLAGLCLVPLPGTAQVVRRRRPPIRRNQPPVPPSMHLKVEKGRVQGEIKFTPLQDALAELAARTGIVFEINSEENDPVTISFFDVPVVEAVERLAEGNDFIMYYGNDPEGGNRIRRVKILTGDGRGQPSLRYIGTGEITKTGEDIDSAEQALRVLGEDADLETRQKAIEFLASSRAAGAVQALRAILSDPAPEMRAAAAEGLASLGAQEALPDILLLLKDRHAAVRRSAVVAVALLGDAENVKDLRPLTKDKDPGVSASAETAIQKLSLHRP